MKIYLEEELKEKKHQEIVAEAGDLGEVAQIFKKNDEVVVAAKVEVALKKNGFVPIRADRIHQNLLGDSHSIKVELKNDTEPLIVQNDSFLPAVSDKEDTLTVVSERMLPVKDDKEMELKIFEYGIENELKTPEMPADNLKVGATISTKTDIGSFRNELLNDIKEAQMSAGVESDKHQAPSLLPGYLNPNISSTPTSFSPVNSINEQLDASSQNVIPIADQPSNTPQNTTPAVEAITPADLENESVSAIRIEATFTPEQVNKLKKKRMLNIGIILFILVVLIVVGYVFGWPVLKEFMGGK